MHYTQRIAKGQTFELENGAMYAGIHFDGCDIVVKTPPLRDVYFQDCQFTGISADQIRSIVQLNEPSTPDKGQEGSNV